MKPQISMILKQQEEYCFKQITIKPKSAWLCIDIDFELICQMQHYASNTAHWQTAWITDPIQ